MNADDLQALADLLRKAADCQRLSTFEHGFVRGFQDRIRRHGGMISDPTDIQQKTLDEIEAKIHAC